MHRRSHLLYRHTRRRWNRRPSPASTANCVHHAFPAQHHATTGFGTASHWFLHSMRLALPAAITGVFGTALIHLLAPFPPNAALAHSCRMPTIRACRCISCACRYRVFLRSCGAARCLCAFCAGTIMEVPAAMGGYLCCHYHPSATYSGSLPATLLPAHSCHVRLALTYTLLLVSACTFCRYTHFCLPGFYCHRSHRTPIPT